MDFIQDTLFYLIRNAPAYARTLSALPARLQALATTYQPPTDLPSIALLLVIAVCAYILLAWVWAMVRFWIRLATRMVFWGALVAIGAYVWLRGVEGVVEDVREWSEVWRAEYGKAQVEYGKIRVEGGWDQPRQGRRKGW